MAEKHGKLAEVRLTTPVSAAAIAWLELGQVVYLDGVVYTGREGVLHHPQFQHSKSLTHGPANP